MTDYGLGGLGKSRGGPYGTNKGDIWFAADWLQDRIKADKGPGWAVIIEMLEKDGKVEEAVYTTENKELIAEARDGHELYLIAQAARN